MKNLITIAVVAMSLATAAIADDRQRHCAAIHSLAETIMTARQNGVSPVLLQTIVAKNPATVAALAGDMVLRAYKQPHWQTDDMKQQAISDFSTEFYVACMEQS